MNMIGQFVYNFFKLGGMIRMISSSLGNVIFIQSVNNDVMPCRTFNNNAKWKFQRQCYVLLFRKQKIKK